IGRFLLSPSETAFPFSHLTGLIYSYAGISAWDFPLIFGAFSGRFNTPSRTSAFSSMSLSLFEDWLVSHDGYAQFNHPGREKSMFYDFRYNASTTDNMVAVETGNRDTGNCDGEYLQYYADALAQGWRLAPTNNQDNHQLRVNSHRTVIIADNLTRNDLLDALKERRVYSSDDPDMRVIFKIGAHFMGEVVLMSSGSYEAHVQVDDNEPITQLEIIDASGSTIASTTPSSTFVEWNPLLTVTADNYYFLKVTQDDTHHDEPSYSFQIAVTAPIWLDIQ
ncbi:MAG: hypothetical protein KKD44_21205, partial [Proteobacteria bacterium]|nr:hypothetical protein [Pseudomonadota bacterium]